MHQTMQAGSKHNRHLHIGTAEKMTAMNEAIDLNNEGMQLMNRGAMLAVTVQVVPVLLESHRTAYAGVAYLSTYSGTD